MPTGCRCKRGRDGEDVPEGRRGVDELTDRTRLRAADARSLWMARGRFVLPQPFPASVPANRSPRCCVILENGLQPACGLHRADQTRLLQQLRVRSVPRAEIFSAGEKKSTDASRRKPSILELESREKVRMPTWHVCSLNRTNQIAHRTTKSAKMREKQNPAATILKGRGLTRSSERRARGAEYPYSRALVASDSLWCRYDAFAVRWERTQTGNSRLPRKGISLAPVC